MARRKNIEHLSRLVDSSIKGRLVYQLIGFPNNEGDFSTSVVRCAPKSIGDALRHYGTFSDDEVRLVSHLNVGEYKSWGGDNCMIIRIA